MLPVRSGRDHASHKRHRAKAGSQPSPQQGTSGAANEVCSKVSRAVKQATKRQRDRQNTMIGPDAFTSSGHTKDR